MIERFLEGNRQFVAQEFNRNRDYYQSIAVGQTPEVLWIGCSDSRVSEDVITGSRPGSIFVHRNIANIVAFNDVNFASILEYAVVHLRIPDIVVCGHTNCGGIIALDQGVRENYIADWLLIASGAKEKVDRIARQRPLSDRERLDLLVRENVKLQIKHLKNMSLIRNCHQKGPLPRIHGWIYALETGKISVLVDGREPD